MENKVLTYLATNRLVLYNHNQISTRMTECISFVKHVFKKKNPFRSNAICHHSHTQTHTASQAKIFQNGFETVLFDLKVMQHSH